MLLTTLRYRTFWLDSQSVPNEAHKTLVSKFDSFLFIIDVSKEQRKRFIKDY